MVLPVAVAARAASAAGNVGATALGLSMGKSDLDLTRDLFKLQMQQAKRLWTADWAENSIRHGEACLQSAQQHTEAQALARAAYYQAEKLQSQSLKLARDQDSRAYEMSWRAEVRESLRDELGNQYNRYNTVMLCDTVCLSCVFSLVAEANIPETTPGYMINLYLFCLGTSITLFTVSLWLSVMVVRRLHEHTAAILERKLFARADLSALWSKQKLGQPTGPQELYLLHQAYEKWVDQYLEPFGGPSVHLMTLGIILMFVTAGILTHNLYHIEYSQGKWAVPLFWTAIVITSSVIIFLKIAEDRLEKRKSGVYDHSSWQDEGDSSSSTHANPFAKITRAAKELYSSQAAALASAERVSRMDRRAQSEWHQQHRATSELINSQVAKHRSQSSEHALRMRQEILQLLTTAGEELDALPEELTAKLNKLLHKIDEADGQTAKLVTMDDVARDYIEDDDFEDAIMNSGGRLGVKGSARSDWSRHPSSQLERPMSAIEDDTASSVKLSWYAPSMDAQRIPISLGALRRKLGEASVSTLLRFRNTTDEPIRLQSGLKLKEGKYYQSVKVEHGNGVYSASAVVHTLYPGSEIPAHSEVVIAAHNTGSHWMPTSGVEGELVYTTKDESWVFCVKFSNPVMVHRKPRQCQVTATRAVRQQTGGFDMEKQQQFWTIERTEVDVKANSEVIVTIQLHRGEDGRRAELLHQQSQEKLQSGYLLKHRHDVGLGLQWHRRWFVLTRTALSQSEDRRSQRSENEVVLRDICAVRKGTDTIRKHVLEVHVKSPKGTVHRYSAASASERDAWIHHITEAAGLDFAATVAESSNTSQEDGTNNQEGYMESGVECVQTKDGTILPNV